MLVKLLPNTKLHKNHPVGAELFHADGCIDRGQHDEPNACFLQLFGKFAGGGGGIFLKKCITWCYFKNVYSLHFVKGHAVLSVGSIILLKPRGYFVYHQV
jgi:hypothetical protein